MWYVNKELGIAVNLAYCEHIKKQNWEGDCTENRFDVEYVMDGVYNEISFDTPEKRDKVFDEICAMLPLAFDDYRFDMQSKEETE